MNGNISSDSTFYSCFFCDIQQKEWLYNFLEIYDFCLGKNIMNEIPKKLAINDEFKDNVLFFNEDFFELVKPYFGRDECHKKDGEYEAIGLACHLYENYSIRYLIIDDRKPYNFVLTHFPYLNEYLKGTIGFIRDCCCVDNQISKDHAIEILNCIKREVEISDTEQNETLKRPCSLDLKNYERILIKTLEYIYCWNERN